MKIGIDIGGTKLAAIALDNMGNQLAVKNIPTPKGYKNALNEIIRVTEQLEKEVQLPVKGIGISLAGIVNNNGSVKYAANLPWLIEKPLISDLKKYKHNCPIAIANDANCFTMSEAFDGAAANTKVVFGLTLGTGVGGGIVINGGALTHYGLSLKDSLMDAATPLVEIHISNIHQREIYRRNSVVEPISIGQVAGFGTSGYLYALELLVNYLRNDIHT